MTVLIEMQKTVQIISDLHSEFGIDLEKFAQYLKPSDIIVLAGDIVNNAEKLEPYLLTCLQFCKSVVFVCGNHEYYKKSTDEDYERVCSAIPSVYMLQKKRIQIEGIWFCGATLWSNVSEKAKRAIRDPLSYKEYISLHHDHLQWLDQNIDRNDIVVTHHLPSFKLVHPDYQDSPINTAFATDMDNLILDKQPQLWICGHTHKPMHAQIGTTVLLCNPVGYPGENQHFNVLIVQVPVADKVDTQDAMCSRQ